jgi:hypothetical protein
MGALTGAVILTHFICILLVLVGVLWTRGRPVWTLLHLACLVWGIVVEVGPWPCPLTMLEDYLEGRGGEHAVEGNFILHWVRSLSQGAVLAGDNCGCNSVCDKSGGLCAARVGLVGQKQQR